MKPLPETGVGSWPYGLTLPLVTPPRTTRLVGANPTSAASRVSTSPSGSSPAEASKCAISSDETGIPGELVAFDWAASWLPVGGGVPPVQAVRTSTRAVAAETVRVRERLFGIPFGVTDEA